MPVSIAGPKFYVFDSNGDPVEGAKINTYEIDGVTRKETFNGEDGAANSNPVLTNAAGYADVYLDGVYAIVVTDADDNLIWSENPVTSGNQLAQAWVNKRTAAFASTTSITIAGNCTSIFMPGRRIKIQDSTDLYGAITASSYSSPNTTVTVDIDDSTALSASVEYAWAYFLEQGEAGPQGPQGETGPQGPQGEAGTGITEGDVGFTLSGGATSKTLTVDDDLVTSAAARRDADNTMDGSQLFGAGVSFGVTDKGSVSSGTVTFALSNGPRQKLTVGGDLTIAISDKPSGRWDLEIELVNGGSATLTLPTTSWLLGDGTVSTTFADMGVTLASSGVNTLLFWGSGSGTVYGRAG